MGCVFYDSSRNTVSNTLECIDRSGTRYKLGMGTTTFVEDLGEFEVTLWQNDTQDIFVCRFHLSTRCHLGDVMTCCR
jgi:hypothetical protein